MCLQEIPCQMWIPVETAWFHWFRRVHRRCIPNEWLNLGIKSDESQTHQIKPNHFKTLHFWIPSEISIQPTEAVPPPTGESIEKLIYESCCSTLQPYRPTRERRSSMVFDFLPTTISEMEAGPSPCRRYAPTATVASSLGWPSIFHSSFSLDMNTQGSIEFPMSLQHSDYTACRLSTPRLDAAANRSSFRRARFNQNPLDWLRPFNALKNTSNLKRSSSENLLLLPSNRDCDAPAIKRSHSGILFWERNGGQGGANHQVSLGWISLDCSLVGDVCLGVGGQKDTLGRPLDG